MSNPTDGVETGATGENVQPPPAPVANVQEQWTLFRELPTFDMRNGDVADVTPVLIKATLPPGWRWVPIAGMPSSAAIHHLDSYIKSHMVHMMQNPIPGINGLLARKIAIVLGTIRAVNTTFFRLANADFISGELVDGYMTATGGTREVPQVTVTANAGVSAAALEVLNGNLNLNTVEQAAICALVKCAAGVIPMQGYSLIMTHHHYLTDNESQSRKVFAVVEKAYWRDTDIGTWFTDDLVSIQDACWHKATHPVQLNIKTIAAMDSTIPEKLVTAGAGACASRLPAAEPEVRAGTSYMKLFMTVKPMLEVTGSTLNFAALEGLLAAISNIPKNAENIVAPPQTPDHLKDRIKDRASALKELSSMLARSEAIAAQCYGFYCSMTENSMVLGGQRRDDSLRTANSLSKLSNSSHASYTAGGELFRDYQSARNKMRENGDFLKNEFIVE